MRIEPPEGLLRYCLPRGSVAVDGVSLTIARTDPEGFEVAIIPHTAAVTRLGLLEAGDSVNIEADSIVRAVERILDARSEEQGGRRANRIDGDFLKEHGFG